MAPAAVDRLLALCLSGDFFLGGDVPDVPGIGAPAGEVTAAAAGAHEEAAAEVTSPDEGAASQVTSPPPSDDEAPRAIREVTTSGEGEATSHGAAAQEGPAPTAGDAMEVTSPSASGSPPLQVRSDSSAAGQPGQRRRQRRPAGSRKQRRQGAAPGDRPAAPGRGRHQLPTVPTQGLLTTGVDYICQRSFKYFVGVGSGRARRVRMGQGDGRLRECGGGLRARESETKAGLCRRFFWHKYTFAAEGLPDRWACGVPTSRPARPDADLGPLPSQVHLEEEDDDDAEERRIAAAAFMADASLEPTAAVLLGPGSSWGPTRYLGVMRPAQLFLEFGLWCGERGVDCPSWCTFLRALKATPCLRFRKRTGQHACCDYCLYCKRRLRRRDLNIQERATALEEYCHHLHDVMADRLVDSNFTELSLSCSRAMREQGLRLSQVAQNLSVLVLRVDGVDQAKFRVPRTHSPSHAFEKLLRPALHVTGAWSHGFGFHLAVSDCDMKKDSNNTIEVIARMLESIYDAQGALPLSLYTVLDNTCRENKNNIVLKFFTKLVQLGVFRSITVAFPEVGHTHGPLDGAFGWLCVRLSLAEFDDADEVVELLQGFLANLQVDPGSKEGAKAYKLDQAADWVTWLSGLDYHLTNITMNTGPHSFHLRRRKDLPHSSAEGAVAGWPGAPPARADDLILTLSRRMSSRAAEQRLLLMPAQAVATEQPRGIHARKIIPDDMRRDFEKRARVVMQSGGISRRAYEYILHWVSGQLRQHPRLDEYTFLIHRASSATPVALSGPVCERGPSRASQPRPLAEPLRQVGRAPRGPRAAALAAAEGDEDVSPLIGQ
ncbi:unnamed protein product [Prorocentrum cordatum]|uniref:DUF7869 domain-containing protein n=1 Tax=Prorocentrum cordatum TaxID=2364126 RepID=A0ABN9R954_9DINO|nr:unnamed protein product [Polarella glacialis]